MQHFICACQKKCCIFAVGFVRVCFHARVEKPLPTTKIHKIKRYEYH